MELVWPAQAYLAGYAAALTPAGRRTTCAARSPPTSSSRRSRGMPTRFSPDSWIKRSERQPHPSARRVAGQAPARATFAGYGMANSAARSGSAGSRGPRRCRRIASAISDIRWCRGSDGMVTRRLRWRRSFPRRRAEGLRYVEITTDPDNSPRNGLSRSNGGVLVERFVKLPAFGGKSGLRYQHHPFAMSGDDTVIVGGGIGGLTLALCLHAPASRAACTSRRRAPAARRRHQHPAACIARARAARARRGARARRRC